MRSKAPLALMEQLVMVLVFALAAALCVQVFVLSDQTSRRNEARDRAVLAAQNLAEALKGGDVSTYLSEMQGSVNGNSGVIVFYDADWQCVTAGADNIAYYAQSQYVETPTDWLWQAEISVCQADGTVLFSIPVAGQNNIEVDDHG
jgi:hypothetical protein